MYSTGSFWRKNYSTRSYCVYIIEMQRPSPAARRHLFWTSLSLSTTVLLVPLARRIFALLFYGSRRSPGAGPTGPRGQDAPGRTPPTTTNNNKVACISCLVNTGLLAGAFPRCCPACPHHIALHLALIPSHCDPPPESHCVASRSTRARAAFKRGEDGRDGGGATSEVPAPRLAGTSGRQDEEHLGDVNLARDA